MVSFGIIITIALIVAGIIFKRSKSIAIIQAIWLWIIMGFMNGGVDFQANEDIYHLDASIKNSGIFEWISRPVARICQQFGWDYWQYNALLVGITVFILLIVTLETTENISLFFSMFMIYPFMDSVIQKRFFYAFAFCVFSIIALQKKRYRSCIIYVVIALGFHFSAILIIPYLFMDLILKNHSRFIWIILAVEIYLLMFQRGILGVILNSRSAKVNDYVNSNIHIGAGLLYMAAQIAFVVLVILIENDQLFFNNLATAARENFIIRLNIFSLIFLPLLMMDSTFFRYYRIVMVVSYFDLADRIQGSFLKNDYRYYLVWIYIILMLAFQIGTVSAGAIEPSEFVNSMFKYNQLLNIFMR